MKNILIKSFVVLLSSALLLNGCKKGDEVVSETVRASYPVITLVGDAITGWEKNKPYTEAGATVSDTLFDGIKDQPLTPISNNVDVSKAGVYQVAYEYTNKKGFKTQVARNVFISNADVVNINYAGSYKRLPNMAPVIITNRGGGIYTVKNPGGVPLASGDVFQFEVTMYQIEDSLVDIPPQFVNATIGTFECLNEKVTPTGFTWVVNNPNFGKAVRTFAKD